MLKIEEQGLLIKHCSSGACLVKNGFAWGTSIKYVRILGGEVFSRNRTLHIFSKFIPYISANSG